MFRIKLSILLFSLFIITSCSAISYKDTLDPKSKFSLANYTGDEQSFIFYNILKQTLILNGIYSSSSTNAVSFELSGSNRNLVSSVTKVSSRKEIYTGVTITVSSRLDNSLPFLGLSKNIKYKCGMYTNQYSAGHNYVISTSSANISNYEASKDTFIINSENVAAEIADDLVNFSPNMDCEEEE